MHDLNTINRLNVQGFAADIERQRAAGKHVVVKHEGLHIVRAEPFDTSTEAQHAFEVSVSSGGPGSRTVLYTPTGIRASGQTRALQGPADVTLGDYITRKTADIAG